MPRGNNILDLDLLIEQPGCFRFGNKSLFVCGNTLPAAAYRYYQLLQEPAFDAFLLQDAIVNVRRLLQKLPTRQAQLCALYFIDDFSYEEIARFTNLSPTTVKNHIAWSMIILRNYMNRPKAPV